MLNNHPEYIAAMIAHKRIFQRSRNIINNIFPVLTMYAQEAPELFENEQSSRTVEQILKALHESDYETLKSIVQLLRPVFDNIMLKKRIAARNDPPKEHAALPRSEARNRVPPGVQRALEARRS